ncbi:MAG: hypothetical protein Q4A32_04265 [Lachnospiraceae bacterium]|nr:hypothetical protein [Lachnospiraceae bacterium]
MSGMKRAAISLAVVLSASLLFTACGKKEKEPEQTNSIVEFEDDFSTPEPTQVPQVDPNESYAAQVQAELEDVEIPTTDITTKTGAVEVPALSQTMTAGDGNIQLKVPENWTDLKGQIDASGMLDGYVIQTGSMADAQFLTYTSEAKSDAENAPITSVDEYSGWLVQYVTSVSSPLQNATVLETSDIRLTQSTMDGKKTVLKGNYNGQDVVFFVYAVEGANSYHQFCAWAPEGRRNTAEATFDAVVNSFAAFS